MIKKYFNLSEAVRWLSDENRSPVSEMDLVRETAAARLLVCFHYCGYLGVYSREPVIWPELLSRHYFDGYLHSKTPVQLNTRIDSIGSHPTYEDLLAPRVVEVVETHGVDPALPEIKADQFLGRADSLGGNHLRTKLNRDDWLFRAEDLRALSAAKRPIAQTSMSAAPGDPRVGKPKETRAERGERIAARRGVLKAARVRNWQQQIAQEEGDLSASAIKNVLRKHDALTRKAGSGGSASPFGGLQTPRKRS